MCRLLASAAAPSAAAVSGCHLCRNHRSLGFVQVPAVEVERSLDCRAGRGVDPSSDPAAARGRHPTHFAVIALTCTLPEPLADIAFLHAHGCFHSLCGLRLNVSRATINGVFFKLVRGAWRQAAVLPDLQDHSFINGPSAPSTGSVLGNGTCAMRCRATAITCGSSRRRSHSRPSA